MTPPRVVSAAILLALLGAACGETTESPDELVLLTHDSFAISESVLEAFEADTGVAVRILKGGDAGAMLSQAILTKDNPLADVMFGIDNTFLSRAVAEGIFEPYRSEGLDSVFELLRRSPDEVTPIDFGDVCINYEKAWFEETALDVPQELDDLRSELYASFLTVEHPATSSPGLAFMLATIEEFGEDSWLDFWADLRAAGVRVAPDWNTAYYADFMPYGGSSAMVVSYASSPPAEVIFATEPIEQAPTGVVDAGCYRQVEFAGVLAGTPYPTAAGQLIDFMLSVEFQENIPLTWFVFPANTTAPLPDEFVIHTVLPESPAQMDPERIARNRDRWISQWVSVMEG